ncbi:MAG: hypothetical protein IT379_21040 [Deltaproteobacteria bacterium]|nr:hypothetical protein [Deltaproteobacteria bacterium]
MVASSFRHGLVAASLCLVGLASTVGCEEAQETVICDSASDKLCNKWFSCRPAVATALWRDEATCRSTVQSTCSNTEILVGCDIDNSDLAQCDQSIEDSACGALPASCEAIIDCSTMR